MVRRPATTRAFLVAFALLGCGGSQQVSAEASWSGEITTGAPGRLEEPSDDFANLPDAAPAATSAPDAVLPGVRHDVLLARPGTKEPPCACLDVAVGAPTDPFFAWHAGAPVVGPGATVIALRLRAEGCAAGAGARPSISAVDREGADIVVVIEELPAGRPQASGAVIPRPAAGGGVYLRPDSQKLPYAKPTGGAAGSRCRVM